MYNVALIPARCGSKRIPDKNIRLLGGEPLLVKAINHAKKSNLFDEVVIITDSAEYEKLAKEVGAKSYGLRPPETATSTAPDILWVKWILSLLKERFNQADLNLHLLRPTSPFRTAATMQRAYDTFINYYQNIDSLRAVEEVSQHPGKMWINREDLLLPLLPFSTADGTPWHSSQKPALPKVYVQNACLEIVKARVVEVTGTISGTKIAPFLTNGIEGLDINTEEDFLLAEILIKR